MLRLEEHSGRVYVLLRGTVRISLQYPGHTSISLNLLGAGEVLGEVCAVDGLGHSASVVAVEEVQALHLPQKEFCHCIETMPELAHNMIRILTHRLRRVTGQLGALASLSVQQRIARQLLVFADDYGIANNDGSTFIPLRLTQSDLASLVSATREQVNRDLVYYRERGYLSIEKSYYFRIHNRPALLQHCCS